MGHDDEALLSETRAAEAVCDITSDEGLFDEAARESCTMALSKCSGDIALTLPTSSVPLAKKSTKQGTLHGVYLPCLQTLIGVVYFCRMPWVTSQAGVPLTCFLFVMCQSVGYLTALSICALVTNGKIAGGGVYYLISRTIGIETGLSVGILVFCGASFALAFMVLGAVETLANIFDTSQWIVADLRLQALILLGILGAIAGIGMKYIAMVGFACFLMVTLSIASSFLGLLVLVGNPNPSEASTPIVWFGNVHTNFTKDPTTGIMPTVTTMISVVYPGTTGYMAGAMRSGVLATPSRSIPLGTLAAMVTVLVLNLACVISVGSTIPNHVLKADKFILSTVAWPTKQLINLGIFFSAIGGALQNLTGHPRMLAAMANDNVIPFLRPFAAKDGDEPRKAVGLILALSCLPCIAGNLDFLAPFLTMSSLMLCATLNFACFSMALGHAPGFRPKWHYFHWSTALLGSMGSIGLMLFFSWTKAILAILLCVLLRLYVRCLGFKKDWGSSIRGMHLELACWLLQCLNQADEEEHTKNWRPQILVFCKTNGRGLPSSTQLLDFASQLKEGHGLVEVVNLLAGKDDTTYDVASQATHRLRAHLLSAHIAGFGHVYACKSILKSMGTVAEASGMGPLRSNTVLLGWPKAAASRDQAFLDAYVDMLHEIINCKKALLLAKGLASFPSNDDSRRGTVDIWWVLHDGGLLLLIPYLLRLHFVWRKTKLRLFTVVSMKEDAGEIAARLADFLEGARIEAEVHVVPLQMATISSLLIKRTKDELRKKKEALAAMKVTTLSFTIRDGYEQLVDDLSDVGTAIEDDDERSRGKRFAASPPAPSADTRLVHAQLMNQHMLEHSGDASLVVVNLPRLIGVPASNFVTYVEALTQHLSAVLLVRGSGREVVTLNA
ncbi:hypothetical protein SDRG_05907 [Saprolegnia diclina VS20]|uniref:Amino acid permease/ SLC12A domain-containing protein n=1 Tax=Saprolegnia diclina (strain VS20) TaxID=1156394 RepID=T0S144_SAPDV|nr:hypothetical protein SDRG_05907 [Saprolegnia diclina VS20]EQC36452.1 hypothetical protein SDRG_05907 [Saprolegnia diclina VS20]|eukprot:XP_008609873.1 hypothetical protein SDRG_05907 [Saprolegnia diclina VS20]